MQKRSLKLYFSTLLISLTLTSFSFAGNDQCPLAPPPPPNEGRASVTVIANTNPTVGNAYQFLKGFWEFLAQGRDLF